MSQLGHSCDGLALICMDWRLRQSGNLLSQIRKLSSVDCFDLVSLAGSAKNMLDSQRDLMVKHIGLCDRLHHGRTVILTNHTDCGAYGASGTREQLIADLKKGKEITKKMCPDTEVIMILINLVAGDGEWETRCELID